MPNYKQVEVQVFELGTDKPTHHSLILLKNGGVAIPLSGAQARRAAKEGNLAFYLYMLRTDVNPQPGSYVLDSGVIFGPYEEGDKLIDYQGTIVATNDPEIKHVPRLSESFLKRYSNNSDIQRVNMIFDVIESWELELLIPSVDEEGYARLSFVTRSWTDADLLEVMNLGMQLRQDQLNGSASKSGNQVLEEWKNKKLSTKS